MDGASVVARVQVSAPRSTYRKNDVKTFIAG
jgi:hypothetical protein